MTGTTPRLEEVILACYTDATGFHGDLGLPIGPWRLKVTEILRRCRKDPEDPAAAVFAERLHSRDLYLATCCAEPLDTAWRRFESLYQRFISELVRCNARNAPQALDVGEGLIVDLFLPDKSGRSRIASYDGRSTLATWLHVIVTHRVANERVRKWNRVERPGDIPEIADHTMIGELEAGLLAERYGPAIEDSLRKACQGLSTRESRMLLWRYQRGLLLEEIARLLSIHPSTVCRQLERLQERLRKDVIATLTSTYGLSDTAVDECLQDVLQNRAGSVSLLRLIGDKLPGDEGDAAVPQPRLRLA
jgi:RNA polymerase sigma-70 factor